MASKPQEVSDPCKIYLQHFGPVLAELALVPSWAVARGPRSEDVGDDVAHPWQGLALDHRRHL